MSKNKQLPAFRFLLLCREITQNADGSLNFLNIVKGLSVSSPSDLMPRAELNLMFAVGALINDKSQTHSLRLTIEAPDNSEEEIGFSQVGLTGGRFIDVHYAPLLMYASLPGLYWLKAYLGHQLFGQYPFEIRHEKLKAHQSTTH